MYIFRKAFVWGTYEILDKGNGYFHVLSSNITNYTINVLGYRKSDNQEHRVMADDVAGLLHIGFIGRHQCCVFAFGFLPLHVYGVNASSSG